MLIHSGANLSHPAATGVSSAVVPGFGDLISTELKCRWIQFSSQSDLIDGAEADLPIVDVDSVLKSSSSTHSSHTSPSASIDKSTSSSSIDSEMGDSGVETVGVDGGSTETIGVDGDGEAIS